MGQKQAAGAGMVSPHGQTAAWRNHMAGVGLVAPHGWGCCGGTAWLVMVWWHRVFGIGLVAPCDWVGITTWLRLAW